MVLKRGARRSSKNNWLYQRREQNVVYNELISKRHKKITTSLQEYSNGMANQPCMPLLCLGECQDQGCCF